MDNKVKRFFVIFSVVMVIGFFENTVLADGPQCCNVNARPKPKCCATVVKKYYMMNGTDKQARNDIAVLQANKANATEVQNAISAQGQRMDELEQRLDNTARQANRAENQANSVASTLGWLWPAAILLLLVAIGGYFFPRPAAVVVEDQPAAAPAVAAPAQQIPAYQPVIQFPLTAHHQYAHLLPAPQPVPQQGNGVFVPINVHAVPIDVELNPTLRTTAT